MAQNVEKSSKPDTEVSTAPDTVEDTELVTLGEKHYFKSSLDAESLQAFEQAIEIQGKIKEKQVDIRDLTYAVKFLTTFIEGRADDFKEFTPPEPEPEPAEPGAENDKEESKE